MCDLKHIYDYLSSTILIPTRLYCPFFAMLLPLDRIRFASGFIIVLIHLFGSFGQLNGIELPLRILHEGVSGGKSMDFARRINFPLANSDNGVELPPPPNPEDSMELNTPKGIAIASIENDGNLVDELPIKSEMPEWLQIQIQQQQQQQPQHQRQQHQQQQQQSTNIAHQHAANYHHPNMLPKHTQQSGKHHSVGRQVSSAAAPPTLRRCSIEISSKIPGVCQAMGSIGNACVSGDYVDVFNAECL